MSFAVLAAALLSSGRASASSCEEKHEDCVEDCRIEFGMEVGRQQLFKCLKRCESRRGDCGEYLRSEREADKRSRISRERISGDADVPAFEPDVREPVRSEPREDAEVDAVPVRAAEDSLPEPAEGEDRPLVRIEGARETVVGLANIDDLELVLHSGKQLGNDRMSVTAWASPGALIEVKSRGCRVKVLMSAEKVRQRVKRSAESERHRNSDSHDSFDRGGE